MQKSNNIKELVLRSSHLKRDSLSYYIQECNSDTAFLFLAPTHNPIKYFQQLLDACSAMNYTCIAPTQIGNTQDTEVCINNVLEVIEDIKVRYNIKKIIISGLSGGGRTAAIIGLTFPELFTQIITFCGTHPMTPWMNEQRIIDSKIEIHTITGTKDKLRKECQFLHDYYFAGLPNVNSFQNLEGLGHALPNTLELTKLFEKMKTCESDIYM